MAIDTLTFQYEQSRWQDLFMFLQNAGFEVYSPGVKVGECISPYIVIKNDGVTKLSGISTNGALYTIMCYVPKQSYSTLEVFVHSVKEHMKELQPLFKPYGVETPSYYDDTYKAHMISVEYVNNQKI